MASAEDPDYTMHCLVCGEQLKHLWDAEDQNPNDAVVWRTKGNYGSTVYDNPDALQSLEAYVCDRCMTKHADRIFTARPDPTPRRSRFQRGIHPDRDWYALHQEAITVLRKLGTKHTTCPLCGLAGAHTPTCDLGELIRNAIAIWPDEAGDTE